jgi:hypothetical protein
MGMQLVATCTRKHRRICSAASAIEQIPQQRRTDGCHVNPDLMGTPRGDRHVNQAGVGPAL